MKKITLFIAILFCLTATEQIFAQFSLKEIPLKQQVENSSLVVEGKVISKQSFWNANHDIIYTANTIEVYKVFKGKADKNIEVITVGGAVGLRALMASHSLKLQKGDIGVFTLYDNDITISESNKTSIKKYISYSTTQGFYKYDLYYNVVRNPFSAKKGITSSFYNEIMKYTNSKYIEVAKFNTQVIGNASNQAKGLLAPVVTSFSPSVASAGTKTVLTIDGTGFGTTQGIVGFRDANSGGETQFGLPIYINALDTQILSWSDTQITVEIPSSAGTGDFRVSHNDGSFIASLTDLTITYAESNVEGDYGDGELAYQVQHIGDFLNNGYTWRMQTDFFNDTEHPGAKASFERAFEIWRCTVDVNWLMAGSGTSVDVVGASTDGTNVIRFDNGSELGAGVLGTCYSWYSSCGSSPVNWYVSELDIVFDDGTNWYFGTGLPALTQYDFESVTLHELGHGNQLGHIIDKTPQMDNGNDVMHYALSNSEYQRVLTANNIAGASSVHARSTSAPVCGKELMIDYAGVCNLGLGEEELNNAISLYPNPAKSKFYIKNLSFVNLQKVEIYDISGRLISQHDISNTSSIKTISVEGALSGVYFVNIHSDLAMITKKIVIN